MHGENVTDINPIIEFFIHRLCTRIVNNPRFMDEPVTVINNERDKFLDELGQQPKPIMTIAPVEKPKVRAAM